MPREQSVESVIAEMTEGESLDRRKTAVREWWNANSEIAWKRDFDAILIDGFGFNLNFGDSDEARALWNQIYDALIVGIRAEEKDWKP